MRRRRRSCAGASIWRPRRAVATAPRPRPSGRDPGPLLVAASVGPYGAVLADGSEYTGALRPRPGRARGTGIATRLVVLAAAGPDRPGDARRSPRSTRVVALVDLLSEGDGPPAWLSFTCADGARTRQRRAGRGSLRAGRCAPSESWRSASTARPHEHVAELVGRARAVTTKPIVVYPNSGERWDRGSAALGRRSRAAGGRGRRPGAGSRPGRRSWAAAAGSARTGSRSSWRPVSADRIPGEPAGGATSCSPLSGSAPGARGGSDGPSRRSW